MQPKTYVIAFVLYLGLLVNIGAGLCQPSKCWEWEDAV